TLRKSDAYAAVEEFSGPITRTSGNRTVTLKVGDHVGPGDILRTANKTGAIEFKSGTRVEIHSLSELSLQPGEGVQIQLERGGIIVNGSESPDNFSVSVHTADVAVSGMKAAFLVNTAELGSYAAAIRGDVVFRHEGEPKLLLPGQLLATNPLLKL